jgi:hypothetical protein
MIAVPDVDLKWTRKKPQAGHSLGRNPVSGFAALSGGR